MAQETQTGALYQPKGVGWGGRLERRSKGRRYIYFTHGVKSMIHNVNERTETVHDTRKCNTGI